jgi:hypothetical protein
MARHLCAAVHLDSQLAAAVIRWVLEDRHRALVPVQGIEDVDLGLVARHALVARRRHRVRDAVVAAMLVAFLAFLASDPVAALTLAVPFFFMVWVVVMFEGLFAHYSVLAHDLSQQHFGPDSAPVPASPRLRGCLARIEERQCGNVAVYSGYSPFAGSGMILDAWSVSVDTTKASTEGAGNAPEPFTVEELHSEVLAGLAKLQWVELKVTQRVFVSGLDVRDDARFLADPDGFPAGDADPDLLRRLLNAPEDTARHYTCIYVSGWRGDLVATMHLRFVQRQETLFTEATWSVLPPLKEPYYVVDSMLQEPLPTILLTIAWQTLKKTPLLLATSIFTMLGAALAPILRALRQKREDLAIRARLRFDYGAVEGVRERAADNKYHRYFQKLDNDMFVKTVQDRVLTTVITFLDGRGVDTGSLSERSKTIMNYGVMLSGQASLRADSLAVGENARASTRVFPIPGRRPPAPPPPSQPGS